MATALIASRVSRFFAPPLYDALSERYRAAAGAALTNLEKAEVKKLENEPEK
jgi:hypothetical protein